MTTLIDPDRQSRVVWMIVAIIGAVLCVVGWYRWIG